MTNLNSVSLSKSANQLLENYSKKEYNLKKQNYNEILLKLSAQTSERIEQLKKTMTPDQIEKARQNNKYFHLINKLKTNNITNQLESTNFISSNTTNEVIKKSKYQDKINELVQKHNINEKFKNRDIHSELEALISKKLKGPKGETLMIRSDLPTIVKNYEVKAGDTLAKISKDFYKDAFNFKNISVVNEIKPPYKLQEGQNLKIVFQQVTAGINDTFETIASKFTNNTISAKALAQLNNKTEINEGDVILIPVQFTQVSTTQNLTNSQNINTNKTFEISNSKMPYTNNITSIEETKQLIEKYASQIEQLSF